MGNAVPEAGLRLDSAHRESVVGANDFDGGTDLDGGRRLRSDARVAAKISSFKALTRDVLQASAVSAVAADVVGFRMEFEVIGRAATWHLPGMTLVKVVQIFEHATAPPRITTVRGFYALSLLLSDLLESDAFAQQLTVHHSSENITTSSDQLNGGATSASAQPVHEGKAALEAVERAALSQAHEDHEENAKVWAPPDGECPICMDRGVQIVPPCGHGLCKACYRDWREHSDACPTCRAQGRDGDLWVGLDSGDVPEPLERVDELMLAVHTFVQQLPRLESQWDRAQHALNRRAQRLHSTSSDVRASAGAPSAMPSRDSSSNSSSSDVRRSRQRSEQEQQDQDQEGRSMYLRSTSSEESSERRRRRPRLRMRSRHRRNNEDDIDEDEEQLQLAIQLSLQDLEEADDP